MRIGIDLDNTIIFYDEAFARAAIEKKLLPAGFKGTKQQTRDAIRRLPNGETEWQKVQGYVYGKGIHLASIFPGVESFISEARNKGHELFIVSHKTEVAHFDPHTNLRQAAKKWLSQRACFNDMPVRFHETREAKIADIKTLELDWFIDDLVEVFKEEGFPKDIDTVLFHTSPDAPPLGHWMICDDWRDIKTMVLDVGSDWEQCIDAQVKAHGGNSRVRKINTSDRTYALKQYPPMDNDPRNRAWTERLALRFFKQNGIANVPEWFATQGNASLLEWIDGSPVRDPAITDIKEAIVFLNAIYDLSPSVSADAMPLASEACLSGKEILWQIEARRMRLGKVTKDNPELGQFMTALFVPALADREAKARQLYSDNGWDFDADLPQEERALIPADFGFHNALRTDKGLVFIDFEYFGWDDPVKVLCDFLLHPAIELDVPLRRHFLIGIMEGRKPAVNARFSALYPLFGLRWALILLNEFLPERWQARAFAQGEQDWDAVKRRQLEKAKAMLKASTKGEW